MIFEQEKFDGVMEHFKHELAGLRIGRASVSLVDSINVDTYGSKMPIAHMASINIPDAKTLTIQPWDKANLGPIEKAIIAANIGLNPVNDGNLVRLNIPPMTEERRKEMVKLLGKLEEQARISLRNVREEFMKELKQQEDSDQITADDLTNSKKDLQEMVDKYNLSIKEIAQAKEKEIMTI